MPTTGAGTQHFADLRAGLLVVGAQHRAARAARRRRELRVAGDHQRLGDQHADAAALAGLRDVQALQQRVVADRVGRVAVRHLEQQLVRVLQVDRRQHAVGRLDDRQALEAFGRARGGLRRRGS